MYIKKQVTKSYIYGILNVCKFFIVDKGDKRMNKYKRIIAQNILNLRLSSGLTQAQLAEKLHYSDKAVSKWERGDSIPEISTLVGMADLFQVSLDYFVREQHTETPKFNEKEELKGIKNNHRIITVMSILIVWFVALFAYVLFDIISKNATAHWLLFLYAVPISMVVWLVFNSLWSNKKFNYVIISLLMWSFLASFQITFLVFGINVWKFYILGVPGQIAILLWSGLRFKKKHKEE